MVDERVPSSPRRAPGSVETLLGLAFIAALGWYAYDYYRAANAGGELNFSCFAYRDVNRNGRYDVGDRPYAGLPVMLRRPGGDTVTASANIAGFANFAMGPNSPTGVIREPGTYTFTASAPSGWVITSGNAEQATTFARLEGAPVALIAERTLVPVGVAPVLTISGSLARPSSGGMVPSLRAVSPSGLARAVPVSDAGRFRIDAAPGPWRLEVRRGSEVVTTREVRVGDYAVVVSRLDPDSEAPAALPVVHRVDFDGLTSSDTLHEIPNGYAGLDWRSWVATHQKLYESPGMVNGTVSSEYFAYNSSGHPAEISASRPFDLAGFHVGVAWPKAEAHAIEVRAWRGDRLAYADQLSAGTAGPVYFEADYRGITRVEVRSAGFWQVVIDDLDYRTAGE